MLLSWRRSRVAGRRACKSKQDPSRRPDDRLDLEEVAVPTHFRCPISLDLMKDPVTLSTGITYDRESIERWIEDGNVACPVTKQELGSFDLIPNHALRKMIQSWCVENRSLGVERIPTPRIPVTPYEVSETCKKIAAATNRGDAKRCHELVGKVKSRTKESERNKRCIEKCGAGDALSVAFESFARRSSMDDEESHGGLLEEILSALTWVKPTSEDGRAKLVSPASLRYLVGFLNRGDLSARQNAALVLKELLPSLDQSHVEAVAKEEGIVEALVKIIREPICPTATKASLGAIFHMISQLPTNDGARSRFLELDLVPVLMNLLVDAEKGVCERVLCVLDLVCDSNQGREETFGHALAIPILVKKILRVSNLATECAISIIWKLCKNDEDERVKMGVVVEAIQLGCFQKLLVVLQVGCGGGMKGKITELLKMMNLYKSRVECIDSSMDFKYMKRPY